MGINNGKHLEQNGSKLVNPSSDEKVQELLNEYAQLQITFKSHFENVISLLHGTRAQEGYVDQLCKISAGKVLESEAINDGRKILESLQASRTIQTQQVEDSINDIKSILTNCELKCLDIDPSLLNLHQANEGYQASIIPNEKQYEIEKLIKELSDEKKKVTDLKETNEEISKEINKNKNELNMKDSQIDKLKAEVQRLSKAKLQPSKISASVQLYHTHDGNTIKDIEAQLKVQLESLLDGVGFVKCHKKADIDESKMLIVLSIITSRVGIDAANAIKDIQRLENTALVLFHIKESHALTKQNSTAVLKYGAFQDLCGIFDMAFANGKGLFQCEMNESALKHISAFIRQGNKK